MKTIGKMCFRVVHILIDFFILCVFPWDPCPFLCICCRIWDKGRDFEVLLCRGVVSLHKKLYIASTRCLDNDYMLLWGRGDTSLNGHPVQGWEVAVRSFVSCNKLYPPVGLSGFWSACNLPVHFRVTILLCSSTDEETDLLSEHS